MRAGVIVAGLLAAMLMIGAAPEPKTSLADIEDEVMCPICGTALGLTEAPQAEAEKDFIRDLIAQGLTKEQIKDELVERFGPEVLATPSTEGFDLAAWLVPGAGIGIAAVAIALALRRWRRESASAGAAKADGPAPSDAEAARLDDELAHFD